MSYVRNLGFEDTPDYDYLRDLFTQALKSTGEVEDGEYDWMKINGGRGWEAAKSQHSHLHASNAIPDSSARELRGTATPRGQSNAHKTHLTADRLNAAQPPPPSPIKQGMGKSREQQSGSGAARPKRQSGAVGGHPDVATPTASTQAVFPNSNPNLPMSRGLSNQNNIQTPMSPPQAMKQTTEPKKSFMDKVMKAICCGR